MKRNLLIGAMFIAALGLLGITERVLEQSASADRTSERSSSSALKPPCDTGVTQNVPEWSFRR